MNVESVSRRKFQWGFRSYVVRVWRWEPDLQPQGYDDVDIRVFLEKAGRPIGHEDVMGKAAPISDVAFGLLKLDRVRKVEIVDDHAGVGIILRN